MNKITREELIRYLYNETSAQKSAAIKAALLADPNLRDAFEKLEDAINNLTDIIFSPGKEAIRKILEYSIKNQQKKD